jgi:hypothetical protein
VAICCPKSIKACALRITRLGRSNAPLDPLTPNSRIQTAGFMQMTLNPDIETGERTDIASQCGTTCITHNDCDEVRGFDVELKLCGVPLTVLEMLTGTTLLADAEGNFLGGAIREGRSEQCSDAKMIELWTKNADKGSCDVDGVPTNLWIHWVFPRTTKWEISGSLDFSNGPLEFTLSAYAENNPNFYPSFPGPAFESYVPGGGDPAGLPAGAPPPVLPDGILADPWTTDDRDVIQESGPIAWKCVDSLPSPISDCDYMPYESTACDPDSFSDDFAGAGPLEAPWQLWDFESGGGN